MPTEYDNDLLREGIFHYWVKEYDSARNYFERALATADDLQTRVQANYYMSLLTPDLQQKRQCLEETLSIDSTHAGARRALAILDGKLNANEIANPETFIGATPVSGAVEVQAERFTCPKCGGRMVYAPDGASLICEYCNQTRRLSTAANGGEQDFFIAMANGSSQRVAVDVQTFACQGCGATFVLVADQISATCAYCGSVHVVAVNEKRKLIEPDSILPIAFEQKQATRQLIHWVEEMKVTPQEQVQPPRGMYLPAWMFDILGNIPWKGMLYRNKRAFEIPGIIFCSSCRS
jgi:Zn finger protein HypA/HybF involved in hydrogenase expression